MWVRLVSFMYAGILEVPGVGISFLGVLRGAISSYSFFFCFFAMRLSKFSTIPSVMALSPDSTSAKSAVGTLGISLNRFVNRLHSCNNSLVC